MVYLVIVSAAVVGIGGLAMANYPAAVLLLAGLLPTYLLRIHLGPLPTTFFELSVATVALVGSTQPLVRQMWQRSWRTLPAAAKWWISLFLLAVIISLPRGDVHALGISKGWVLFPLLFAWLVHGVVRDDERHRRSVIAVLVFSGFSMAVVGLAQMRLSLLRIHGVYDVPNSLALFLVPLVPLALSLRTFPALVAALGMIAAVIATQSVGGAGALVVSLGIFYLLSNKKDVQIKLGLIVLSCLVIATAYLGVSGRVSYFLHSPATSFTVRQQLWSISWQLMRQHPWRGIGLGRFESEYQRVLHERFFAYEQAKTSTMGPIREFVFRDPHNWILSFWLHTGLLGLLSFTALNALALWHGRKNTALCAALVSLLVFGLVDTIYWKNDLAALHWLLVFILHKE